MKNIIKIICVAILLPFVANAADEVGTIVYEFEISEQGATITGVHDENNESITELVIPMTLTKDGEEYKVTAIAAEAFKDMAALKSVSICDNVKEVGARAFANCTSLWNVDLGDGVREMGEAVFGGCKFEFFDFKRDKVGLIIGFDQALNGCDLSDAIFSVPTLYAEHFLKGYSEHFADFSGISIKILFYSKMPLLVAYVSDEENQKCIEGEFDGKTMIARKDRKLSIGWRNGVPGPFYEYPNYNGIDITEAEWQKMIATVIGNEDELIFAKCANLELCDEISKFRIIAYDGKDKVHQLDSIYGDEDIIYTIDGKKLNSDKVENLPHGIYLLINKGITTKIIR